LGSNGTVLYTSPDTSSSKQTISIPSFKTYQYISITATGSKEKPNVLLHSVDYVVVKENLIKN
jgi:hypothetical protein